MDQLRVYIERIAAEALGSEFKVHNTHDLEQFANSDASALFIVQSGDEMALRSTLESPGTVLALVKQAQLDLEQPMHGQIFPIAMPSGDISESLHQVVHYVLSPYFEATTSKSDATVSANIAAARQKLAELELSFFNLQFHTEIALVELPQAPLPAPGEEPNLNALQNAVIDWKKKIRGVVRVSRDPSSGTASEEVLFWKSMENALLHINAQLTEPNVRHTIELLEQGKRFHATVSFPGDTGLPEMLATVEKYNVVLKDMPLDQLLTATTLNGLGTAIDAIFGHIGKKLRPSGYPVWRTLLLVEAISGDFAVRVHDVLGGNMLQLDTDTFNSTLEAARTLFIQWDDLIRDFTSTAREVIRKRNEKFIPVRINSRHAPLRERIEYIAAFRQKHEQLLKALEASKQLQFITQLQAQFMQLALTDVLDTSPEGVAAWNTSETSYTLMASSIEGEVAKLLKSRLEQAHNANEMFRIFGDFNALLGRPAIRGAIHEYQTRLLQVVKTDIMGLQGRVSNKYSQSFASKTCAIYDVPSLSGLVIWLNQIRGRLDQLLSKLSSILGSEWQTHPEGLQLNESCREFRGRIDTQPIIDEWIKATAAKKFTLSDPVFGVRKGKLEINFSMELGALFKELTALNAIGVQVPHTFTATAQSSRKLYPVAIRLIEDIKTLYSCLARLKQAPSAQLLLHKEFNGVYELLLEGTAANWQSIVKFDNTSPYANALDVAVASLEAKVDQTLDTVAQANSLVHELRDCDYNMQTFKLVLDQICGLALQDAFAAQINEQISAELTQRCLLQLKQWAPARRHHNLTLVNQTIVESPPLWVTRKALWDEIGQIIDQIEGHANDAVWDAAGRILHNVQQSLDEASEYLGVWLSFQGLWDLKVDVCWQELGDSLAEWQQVLEELAQSRSALENETQRKDFDMVRINFAQIHAYVNSKYDHWQNEMLSKFAAITATKCLAYQSKLHTAREKHESISFQTGSSELLVGYLETLTTGMFPEQDLLELESAQAALSRQRFHFPKNWVYVDQLRTDWERINSVYTQKSAELHTLRDRLLGDTRSNLQRLESKVTALYEQWQESKPVSGSILPEDALFAIDRIDSQIQGYKRSKTVLVRTFELLGLEYTFGPPLDDMAAEVADFYSAWNAISTAWEALHVLEARRWTEVSIKDIRQQLSRLLEQTQGMSSRVRQYAAFQHVQGIVKAHIQSLTVMVRLSSDAMQQRHWDALFEALQRPPKMLSRMVLGDVWALGLAANSGTVESHVAIAEGERVLEVAVKEIGDFWAKFNVELVHFGKIRVIKNWDEIFERTDEHLNALAAMQSSPYFRAFSQTAHDWIAKLTNARALFDTLVDVQRRWVYLAPVFEGDIRQLMPTESAKFATISSELYVIYQLVGKNPNVLEICAISGINQTVSRIRDLLTRLQKALGEYFERERQGFSRFYFVGDDDLLEMIGNFEAPKVEKHLSKMFAGIAAFAMRGQQITGVLSQEQEVLEFEPIEATGRVVDVLVQVENKVKQALKTATRTLFDRLKTGFFSEPLTYMLDMPMQPSLLALRLFKTMADKQEHASRAKVHLAELATLALEDLPSLRRNRLEALVTELVADDIANPLEYSIDDQDSVMVRQSGAVFQYGFEYQGAPLQLVRTPLIDRLYLTMTQALAQKFGGSPFGPAGTGKTEGIKALGQALGVFVVVFCCDESFDFRALTRLLAGICQTGAWACFDEFNRLESNTLSSVSTQVSSIEHALRDGAETVSFGDRSSPLQPSTALFVTMNPQYIGRNKLPENMKNLFRSFAMSHPDKEKILEVMLYAQGFEHARELAEKMVGLFDALATQCSVQKHYDWGLRAIKSVLRVCGTLKRTADKAGIDGELAVIRLAHEQIIVPKLVSVDLKLYNTLAHVFDSPVEVLPATELSIESAVPAWTCKVQQLHQFLNLHHGIMLVGRTGTGKTRAWRTLAQKLDVETYVVNPKTITKEVLFGKLDFTTREWTDGLFTAVLRKVIDNMRGEDRRMHWIVFDGEIDPEWAENLNSVLDDNKLLTLPSGERLPLRDNVRILFEVGGLDAATPATVSRCGMIWFDSHLIPFDALVADGVAGLNQEELCYDGVVDALRALPLSQLCEHAAAIPHVMEFSSLRALTTLWSLLKALLARGSDVPEFVVHGTHLAVVWAFAGDCDHSTRREFCQWYGALIGQDNLLDYDVSPVSGQLIPWQDSVPELDLEVHQVLDNIVVPTGDTVRLEALVFQFLSAHMPVILCGPPGAGKTMILLSSLRKSQLFDLVPINFSKTTSADMIVKALEQKCVYNGSTLEPAHMGQWVVLFCDEINLPAPDRYGSQQVISFLRDIMEKQGFYKGTKWISTSRIQFVGACNPPTDVGRAVLDSRFLRHCGVVYVDHPDLTSLKLIYGTMCRAVLKAVPELRGHANVLASAMISFFQRSRDNFELRRPQYVYSPRELTRWCRGIYTAIKDQFMLSFEGLARVWAHEALRLFSDRLVEPTERDWTWTTLLDVATEHFKSTAALTQPILYSDWLTKEYASVDRNVLTEFLAARIKVFNEEVSEKPLTLFDDMIEHILRIDRVLRQPQGHMILIGTSSSGKTTLTKLVCWMNGISTFQIQAFRGYSESNFVADLRVVLKRAGCEGLRTCFILDESNLLESSFIEKMNTLLANSEIPGLFEGEEYKQLLEECKKGSLRDGLNLVDEDGLMEWFTRQISANLHVVFTINSLESQVGTQTTTSPALFNRCVLSWMGNWSEQSLAQVCEDQTSAIDADVSAVMVTMHRQAVARHHELEVTPGEFISFLHHFMQIYREKKEALEEEQRHCNVGVDKLKGTMLEVKQLRGHLDGASRQLSAKNIESQAMLQKMLDGQSEAERKKEAGINIRAAIEEQNAEIIARKEVVYENLRQAEPAVLEAQRSVSNIKKQHLDDLKRLNTPPDTIKLVLEAVCYILQFKHATWRETTQSVRSDEFIPALVNFSNEEHMTEPIIKGLQKYLRQPNFTFEAANRAYKACGPLQQWIVAQVAYATVLKDIEPLRLELQTLEAAAEEKRAQEYAINEMLAELEASIEGYKIKYSELIAETQAIKHEMQQVETKLRTSVDLMERLGSEKERWIGSVKAFDDRNANLVGNCLLAAAFMAYCGHLDQRRREDLYDEWQDTLGAASIGFIERLDFASFMAPAAQLLEWKTKGFDDALSLQNAVLISRYAKFPLIIDPSGKTMQTLGKPTVTSFLDASFKKHVESALRFGSTLVIRNAEHFDPVMMPVLNQEFVRRGGRTVLQFNGHEVDCAPEFRLYLLTSEPFVPPAHVSSRVTPVNFTVTRHSLESITLDHTLVATKPELEQKRRELVALQGEYQVQLYQLEVQLLKALDVEGNILDNTQVVSALETIKSKADDTALKSQHAAVAISEIEVTTDAYMPIASACGAIFAIVENLTVLSSNYQFSLEYFLSVFRRVLSNKFVGVNEFVRDLYATVYRQVGPALSMQDRASFALALEYQPTASMAEDWQQIVTDSATVIFTVRDASDPTLKLEAIAAKAGAKCRVVALGSHEGEETAAAALHAAMRQGHWVIVQNLQMGPQWMPVLQELLSAAKDAHPNFRALFTMVWDAPVPPYILRECRLVSVEPTHGLVPAFSECYAMLQPADPPAERARIYFALAWFHCIVVERQRLAGWSKFYDFNDLDLDFAKRIVDAQLQPYVARTNIDPAVIPWPHIRYLLVTTVYGAKVDHAADYTVLSDLVNHAFSMDMYEHRHAVSAGCPETGAPELVDGPSVAAWVAALPAESPRWLGLPESAEQQHAAATSDSVRANAARLV